MNSDSPTKGKAYPVCDDCKRSGKWNCPHLNSDSVEAILKVYRTQHNVAHRRANKGEVDALTAYTKAALLALLEAEAVYADVVKYGKNDVRVPFVVKVVSLERIKELFDGKS